MGYYINTTDISFFIPKKNLDAALSILKDLNTDPAYAEHKHGGSRERRAFSMMPADYHETVTSAQDVFELIGFDTELNDHGLALTYFDEKSGSTEELFLGAVAHLVSPGSYIEWADHDGQLWRHDFDGQTMTVRSGKVVFV